jgi:hypothetical protein
MPKQTPGNDPNDSTTRPAESPSRTRRSSTARAAGQPSANDVEKQASRAQTAVDLSNGDAPRNRSTSMGSEPSEEDIRMRAYHRFLERGASHGQDFEDWLEAERELKNQ